MEFCAATLLLFLFLGGNFAYPTPYKVNPAKAGTIFRSENRNISLIYTTDRLWIFADKGFFFGLESIPAKISYFNGAMETRRKPEHGTIVVIEIPFTTASI